MKIKDVFIQCMIMLLKVIIKEYIENKKRGGESQEIREGKV